MMDEPFGALDAITREHMSDFLLDIWRRTGKTVVFVTHSIDEAVYLSDSVYVMAAIRRASCRSWISACRSQERGDVFQPDVPPEVFPVAAAARAGHAPGSGK